MANQSVSLFSDPTSLDIQRRQALADALSKQADQPDQVFNGPMGQAAIPSYAPITHALKSFLAAALQKKVSGDTADLQQQQRQQAADALSKLYAPSQTLQSGDATFPGAQISVNAPNIPGGGAPLPAATAQLPSMTAPGASMQTQPQGPSTADLAKLMTDPNPYLQQVAPALFQNQLGRDTKLWENGLPQSQASQDSIAQQGRINLQNSEDEAKFKNQLPRSEAERADDDLKKRGLDIEAGRNAEAVRYHNLMSGQGMTEDGQVNPQVKDLGDQLLAGNLTMGQVPTLMRPGVAHYVNTRPAEAFAPTAARRWTLTSNDITRNYLKLPQYELTAQGLPFLQRIDAAMKTKGSVSDQDLLDSFTKLNTAGNAVTDAQVGIITKGKSLKDWASINLQALQNGGVLSDQQRQDLQTIAHKVYGAYASGYQPVYDQVTSQLQAAGVPKAFWTMPDLNKLNAGALDSITYSKPGGGGGRSPQDQQALDWANANPKDPRAQAIKQKLGIK